MTPAIEAPPVAFTEANIDHRHLPDTDGSIVTNATEHSQSQNLRPPDGIRGVRRFAESEAIHAADGSHRRARLAGRHRRAGQGQPGQVADAGTATAAAGALSNAH